MVAKRMKKYIIFILVFFIFNRNLISSSIPIPTPVCDGSCIYDDDKGLICINAGETRVFKINGVLYNCTGCGDCIPISSGSSTGSSVIINSYNPQSDISGQAFLYRDWMDELSKWSQDNSKKWQAFQERALSQGYGGLLDFLNTSSTGIPFNDFVYKTTLSYLYKNLYRDDSKISGASFYSQSPDKRPVRDDSLIPNASFYRGYDKKYVEDGIAKGKIFPEELPATLPELKTNQQYVDAGGVFIGDGKYPMLFRQSGDEFDNMTREQREALRINSILDSSGSLSFDSSQIETIKPENPLNLELKIDEPIKDLIDKATEPGREYLKEAALDKVLGEGAGKTILTGVALYDLTKSIKEGDFIDSISKAGDLAIGFLPETTGASATLGATGGKIYGVIVKSTGAKVLDELKSAGFDLTGGQDSYTYIDKTVGQIAKEAPKEAWQKIKNAIFTPKEIQ